MRPIPRILTFLIGLAAAVPALPAGAQVLDPIQYSLTPQSRYEFGCFGPCECAVIFSDPMHGSFTFYRTSVDPLYTHYALLNIDWEFSRPDTAGNVFKSRVTGHGTWDYGGEAAVTQRMQLDVSIDGGPSQHWDSGVVPPGATFPEIAADCFLHGNACRDTVLRVVASPGGTAGIVPHVVARLLSAPAPNPTSGETEVVFTAPGSVVARVDVIDVGGRVLARLLDRECDAGDVTLHWDGRDAHGTPVGAGTYWVRARAGAASDLRRIVRLQ